MSTPHVSGVIALMLETNPSLTIDEQVEHKTNHEFVYKTFQIRLGLGIRI